MDCYEISGILKLIVLLKTFCKKFHILKRRSDFQDIVLKSLYVKDVSRIINKNTHLVDYKLPTERKEELRRIEYGLIFSNINLLSQKNSYQAYSY